jgi:ATP-binding cassette subfamily F protein uup
LRAAAEAPRPSGAEIRAARKEAGRLERAMEKLDARQAALHEEMAAAASDHGRLRELGEELTALRAEKEDLEARWLEASETAEA